MKLKGRFEWYHALLAALAMLILVNVMRDLFGFVPNTPADDLFLTISMPFMFLPIWLAIKWGADKMKRKHPTLARFMYMIIVLQGIAMILMMPFMLAESIRQLATQ